METNSKKGKTVFVEYSTANKAQHFITVVQNIDHKRIIIGRIFREYNSETKQTSYHATDFAGNQVFADYKELYAIKKQFVEHGESLAMAVPLAIKQSKQVGKMPFSQKDERKNEVKNIREKKPTKEKTKEIPKNNIMEKRTLDQMERVQDSKNTEKYKNTEPNKDVNNSKENVSSNETAESNSEEQIQEKQEQDIASERMDELEDIRDGKDDLEQEQEIEM
jgi:hypothetical protein